MKERKCLLLLGVCVLALSAALASSVPPSFATPNIYAYPEVVIYQPGESFTIDVKISGAQDVYAWDFKLRWNASILNFTEVVEGDFLKGFELEPTYLVTKTYQDEEGTDSITAACTRLGPDLPGVSGSGTLATVTFLVESEGETVLDVFSTELRDSRITPIEHTTTSGFFTTVSTVPTASFTYSPTKPDINEEVLFNASASVDPDGYIVGYFWDFGDDATANETASHVYHNYTAGGTYSVTLTVTDDTGGNNSLTKSVAVRYTHDIMVISVSESPTTAAAGDNVTITVEIENVGAEPESGFDVDVYYDNTLAATQTVTTLASDETRTLTFSWDTAGVADGTYRTKAVAGPVTGETHTDDNTELGGTVTVTVAGEFPWLYVVGGVVVVGVIAGVAVFLMRQGKS